MVSIGKINIGRKEKRSFFPLNHDVNTTSDFGFCQPTLVRHFGKNSKISLRSNAFVRLAPLPVPTFGRIEAKMHTAFVPMKEVFEAFEFQQSNKAVSSALRSYVPTQTDFCQSGWLLGQLWTLFFSSAGYINGSSSNPSRATCQKFLDMIPFRVSIWVHYTNFLNILTAYSDLTYFGDDEYIDIFNDKRIWNDEPHEGLVADLRYCAWSIFCNYVAPSVGTTNESFSLYNYIIAYFYDKVNEVNYSTGAVSTDLVPIHNVPNPILFSSFNIEHYISTTTITDTDYDYHSADRIKDNRNLRDCDSLKEYLYDELGKYNIDYLFTDTNPGSHLSFPIYIKGEASTATLLQSVKIGIHLTPNGKRLMKVLNACGVTFGYFDNPFSLPKLFAYYKTWFDKYNAGRDVQWRDTYCYKLIHSYYDTGVITQQLLTTGEPVNETYEFLNDDIVHNIRYNWLHFLVELPTCTYCLKLDNITVAVDNPILEIAQPTGTSSEVSTLSLIEGSGGVVYTPNGPDDSSMQFDVDNSMSYYQNTSGALNGLSVAVAQVLYKLVNKNSVLGSKVDEYLRAHGIANGLPKSKVLDDESFMCSLDEVFATVNNDQSALGEYAGKGVGSGHSGTMHFETEEDGFLIQLFTMVPLGGYVQASQPEFINRYDFYNSEFDSLGMEPLRMSSVIGRQYFFDTPKQDKTFGFVPRYFQHKIQNNLSNGGFAFLSEQASFLPYSLDRIFSTGSIDQAFGNNTINFLNEPQAVEELRYIGRNEQFGNYDRIFYDMTGRTDNFIVHIIQDFSMYAPMRPISHSFDTFDENNDDSSVELNHA